jgi:hypothetical protein
MYVYAVTPTNARGAFCGYVGVYGRAYSSNSGNKVIRTVEQTGTRERKNED